MKPVWRERPDGILTASPDCIEAKESGLPRPKASVRG